MCLAVPGKIVSIFDEHGISMAQIDYAGTRATACMEYLPDANVGDYAIVHAGFAIHLLDTQEAQKSFDTWNQLIEKNREMGSDIYGNPLET